jgi:hypothetical protein
LNLASEVHPWHDYEDHHLVELDRKLVGKGDLKKKKKVIKGKEPL